ncbi:MAG: Maf family protein [Solirubrobacteraceae bacterium]
MRLILASASPQRTAILARLGIPHEVAPPGVPELSAGEPLEVASENARRKALAGLEAHPGALVLGADTVVALGDAILGKPADAGVARTWLTRLSGHTHHVVGGLCLADASGLRERACSTAVTFRALDAAAIDAYVATGEWRGRAGAYAIQGRGGDLVAVLQGDRDNVVGLCVPALRALAPELLNRP